MTEVVIVEKSGNLKSHLVKSFKENDFYKLAGFKNNNKNDFKFQTKWTKEVNKKKYDILVYGKTEGRANQENKYDFPPPIDNTLFFGNVLLVNKKNDKYIPLSLKDWKTVYEDLFGGFEDIQSEDSDEEEEEEEEDVDRTSTGYAKDGFVVEDEEEEDEEDEEEDEEEEIEVDEEEIDDEEEMDDEEIDTEIEIKPSKKTKVRRSERLKDKSTENIFQFNVEDNEDFDYTSELEEEEYV